MTTPLKAGDPAPDFSGKTTDGKPVSLKDYRGRKLVMYFYPKDDTPGCTKQACSLRDHNADIVAKGAAVLGVSTQDEASHQKFTSKYQLNFPLLADTDGAVGRAYGTIGGPGLISKLKSAGGHGGPRDLRDRREGPHRPRDRQARRGAPRRRGARPALAAQRARARTANVAPARSMMLTWPRPGERHVARPRQAARVLWATRLSWGE
jgi:peroxiredoxin Q/BCP